MNKLKLVDTRTVSDRTEISNDYYEEMSFRFLKKEYQRCVKEVKEIKELKETRELSPNMKKLFESLNNKERIIRSKLKELKESLLKNKENMETMDEVITFLQINEERLKQIRAS